MTLLNLNLPSYSLITTHDDFDSTDPCRIDQVTFHIYLSHTGLSLRIEVAGGFFKITGESGYSEQKLTSSFYRLMKFSRKIPCSSPRILRSPISDALNEHSEILLS